METSSSRQGYAIRNQSGIFFLTFKVVFWMDVFTRQSYRDMVIESFIYCRNNKELKVHAYVIMSNHVHCILSSGREDLSGAIRDLKRHTSKKITDHILTNQESRRFWMWHQMKFAASRHARNDVYQLWTHDNHPVELNSNYLIDQKLNYIHQNPVRAGIVANAEDYIYSSATNYCGGKGLMEIDILD